MSTPRTCVACGATIVWVKTVYGKAMPLDFDPHPDGNIVVAKGVADVLAGLEVEIAKRQGAVLYRTHFVTCPNASEFRLRNKRPAE